MYIHEAVREALKKNALSGHLPKKQNQTYILQSVRPIRMILVYYL